MEIATYTLTLDGMTPLVMNSNAALLRVKDPTRDPALYEFEHYLDKTYRDAAGQFVIPGRAIKKGLVEACRFYASKPKGVGFKSYGPFIQSATVMPPDAVLNVREEAVQRLTLVVNLIPSKGNKGPRGPRTRPCIPLPWRAQTTIQVIDPILTREVLQDIADRAGTQVGFLDGRAIDYGRCLIAVTVA